MLAAAIRITLSNALLPAKPPGFLASQARPRKAEALVTAAFALEDGKHFFFEKKKQKTFGCCRGPIPSVYPHQ